MTGDPSNRTLVEQRELLVALRDEINSLSVEVSSADGAIRVQVDGWGAPTGLWLHERAYRDGAGALAAQIVAIAQAAHALVAQRQAFLLQELLRPYPARENVPATAAARFR
ncbi:hypothetical protein BCA37_24605 [Mycobacterium sp. djl-10]|nr:hypothetical protein BCA37_24605 [Mycobacterium sp. djl-10]